MTGLQKEKEDCQTLADIAEETRGTNLLNNYNNTTLLELLPPQQMSVLGSAVP